MATFTVKEVEGSKRTSDREYTHAIIGRYDFDREFDRIAFTQGDESNYWFGFDRCNKKAGDYVAYRSIGGGHIVTQQDIDRATKDIAGRTLEQYKDDTLRYRREQCLYRQEIQGDLYTVLRWSQSKQNAIKGLAEFEKFWKDLRVVEVVKVK